MSTELDEATNLEEILDAELPCDNDDCNDPAVYAVAIVPCRHTAVVCQIHGDITAVCIDLMDKFGMWEDNFLYCMVCGVSPDRLELRPL
jgi:hypothetical protein